MRSPSRPHRESPSRHSSAFLAASSAADSFWRLASAGSIHGSKSAAASSGKVRRRLVMSPLGSRISAGIPLSSASSSTMTPSPVLPEPVMPTMTPWVVRSAGS